MITKKQYIREAMLCIASFCLTRKKRHVIESLIIRMFRIKKNNIEELIEHGALERMTVSIMRSGMINSSLYIVDKKALRLTDKAIEELRELHPALDFDLRLLKELP